MLLKQKSEPQGLVKVSCPPLMMHFQIRKILNQFLKRKESAPEYLRTSIDEQRIYLNNSTEKNEFIRMVQSNIWK